VPAVAGQTLCDKCQGLATPEPPTSPLEQMEVAGYRLLRELGGGRFSISWLAQDDEGRLVVLKLLRRYAPDPNTVQRFLAEAQRACGAPELDHPHIARPLQAGVHLVSAFFLVYASGGESTLADELRHRGRLHSGRALELCAQSAEGLASAHRAGVLHLDLKPANVGVVRGADGVEHALLLDVITSHLLGKVGLRGGGALPLSSAAYISPEEAAGKPTGARSDLYSLGVLLFQLLSGRLPFMGGNAEELLRDHRERPPLRLRDAGKHVHPELEVLIARLLAKDPALRPSSGDELAVMLRALAPVADSAPEENREDAIDDPVPVVELPRQEASEAPLDPELVRAMMGEVTPAAHSTDETRARRALPSWWPIAAAAAVVIAFTVLLFARGRNRRPPVRRPTVATAPAPSTAPSRPEKPPQTSAAEKPRPSPPQNPNAKTLARAQRAIQAGHPAAAQATLQQLLARPGLPRRDRARASKMMGDTFARSGDKARAAEWYRKSLRLIDDSAERAKVVKLLQSLR
jgi:serine/threonine-protein kinase